MRLYVEGNRVEIDQERERALVDFSRGLPLPDESARTVEVMLDWFAEALTRVDPENPCDSECFIGLVIDRVYLRYVKQGLIAREQTLGPRALAADMR